MLLNLDFLASGIFLFVSAKVNNYAVFSPLIVVIAGFFPVYNIQPFIYFCSKFWKTADEKEAEKLVTGIWDSVVEMTKKIEDKLLTKEADGFGTDFLGSLVNAYHDTDEKKRISIEELVDECKTFYIAGQETSSTMLGWTLLLLAIHTDWQEAARKEVIDSFGNKNPHLDGIVKLKTMTMIINESLRLYPPVISMTRKVEREVQLGKLILPMTLHVANMALHHDTQIWGEDVHLF
ncbi:hypothetical protein ACOSQ4_018015 [Xanthoceras sorbifolium]